MKRGLGILPRVPSWTFLASATATTLTVASFLLLAGILLVESLPVWQHEGFGFITGGEWFYRVDRFGALPMIYGTVVVAAIALLLAIPFGLGSAILTSEYLAPAARRWVKGAIELLAGIPSVVYGLLGILILRNWIYDLTTPFDPLSGDTLLTAGVLLAVMILPTIMSLADDALRGVPGSRRAAARALGLTKAESILHVTLPGAAPGITSAILLALGRALGETIAVFLVVGRQDNQLPDTPFSLAPLLQAGQTLTSKLGGSETNIAYGSPLHWAAICGLGLLLFLLVGLCYLVAEAISASTRFHTGRLK